MVALCLCNRLGSQRSAGLHTAPVSTEVYYHDALIVSGEQAPDEIPTIKYCCSASLLMCFSVAG